MSNLVVRRLTPEDLADVQRLHKYANYNGKPIFAQYDADAAQVLAAAAAETHCTFGLVSLLTDHNEPDEPELVGTITGQLVSTHANHNTTHNSPASTANNTEVSLAAAAASTPTATAVQQQASTPRSTLEGAELVLLTLVVRADVRKQGIGQQLLQAFIAHALSSNTGPPLQQVVTDIALNNKPAWQFFKRSGFQQRTPAPAESTAEAVLQLTYPWPEPGAAHRSITSAACQASAAGERSSALVSRSPPSSRGMPSSWATKSYRCCSMTATCYSTSCHCCKSATLKEVRIGLASIRRQLHPQTPSAAAWVVNCGSGRSRSKSSRTPSVLQLQRLQARRWHHMRSIRHVVAVQSG